MGTKLPRRLPRHTEGVASLLTVEVADHPLHNHSHHRLPALGAPEELQFIPVIHKPALYERCSTPCVVEDIEPCLFVGIAIGIVRPDLVPARKGGLLGRPTLHKKG